jgi:hypothetical protein
LDQQRERPDSQPLLGGGDDHHYDNDFPRNYNHNHHLNNLTHDDYNAYDPYHVYGPYYIHSRYYQYDTNHITRAILNRTSHHTAHSNDSAASSGSE